MKFVTLAFALLLSSFSCFTQTKFTPGYIVKTNGDTVKGNLQEEVRPNLLYNVKFKADINAAEQNFTPADIRAFSYESGNLYKSISFINTLGDSAVTQTCFALVLVEGQNNLYSIVSDKKKYFIITTGESSFFLYDADYDNNGFVKSEGNYASRIAQFSSLCKSRNLHPELVRYDEKEMANFVFDLNNCASPNSVSLNHYKKPKTNTQIVIFAGGISFGNQSQVTAEALFRLSSPQISKGGVLNIGLHFSRTVRIDKTKYGYLTYKRLGTYTDLSVPLYLQYNFLPGPIRPYVIAGFGLGDFRQEFTNDNLPYFASYAPANSQFGVAIIGGIGIEVNIIKQLMAKVDWRYEYLMQFPTVGVALIF